MPVRLIMHLRSQRTARPPGKQAGKQPCLVQGALGFQPSQAAMAAIAEASIQRAMARCAWREGRRRFNLALSASRSRIVPLVGGDAVAAARIFPRLAKPAEVRQQGGTEQG